MRVLVVEDDRMIAKGLHTALKQDGYAVDGVSDGRSASEALRTSKFDIVLLDLGLPERDGILVRAVERGSAADRAGLERGDLIVSAGGRDLDHMDVVYEVLETTAQGAPLELKILRGAEERTVTVTV